MSGRKLLLDSNIIIYLAKKELAPESFLLLEDELFISDISYMETLGYAFADASEKQDIEQLLSILFRFPIEEKVVQKVIDIRQNRRIKLPDAIIAATSLTQDCILVTRNTADFIGLPELKVLNPFE
jgi:toxin FitB